MEQSREETPEQNRKEKEWKLWKSGSGKKRGFSLKKDQLIIGLLTGVLLIVIALPVEKKNKSGTSEASVVSDVAETPEETVERSQEIKTDPYQIEERLEETLSRVEGVGAVKVLITWKTSSEKVVEKDVPGSSESIQEEDANGGKRNTVQTETEEATVYEEKEDGSRRPYVIKEILPRAEGVLVIAEGGGNPVVAENILEAVQALFPLETHKIKIMKMEGS